MAIIKQNTETIFYGTLVVYKNAEGIDVKWVNDYKEGQDAWVITDKGISFSNRDTIEKALEEQANLKSLAQEYVDSSEIVEDYVGETQEGI